MYSYIDQMVRLILEEGQMETWGIACLSLSAKGPPSLPYSTPSVLSLAPFYSLSFPSKVTLLPFPN